eukprot:m.131571 g.131571  ORF g.131571 m.131571 type:complete len:821 (-) comp16464_c2_seq1:87-2549(-)
MKEKGDSSQLPKKKRTHQTLTSIRFLLTHSGLLVQGTEGGQALARRGLGVGLECGDGGGQRRGDGPRHHGCCVGRVNLGCLCRCGRRRRLGVFSGGGVGGGGFRVGRRGLAEGCSDCRCGGCRVAMSAAAVAAELGAVEALAGAAAAAAAGLAVLHRGRAVAVDAGPERLARGHKVFGRHIHAQAVVHVAGVGRREGAVLNALGQVHIGIGRVQHLLSLLEELVQHVAVDAAGGIAQARAVARGSGVEWIKLVQRVARRPDFAERLVLPLARGGAEAVVRNHLPAKVCNHVQRLDDVVEHLLREKVVEVDARPARLGALHAFLNDKVHQLGVYVQIEELVAVRTGARAAATGLDAKEVAEEGDDEGVVEHALLADHDKGENAEALELRVAEQDDVAVHGERLDGPLQEVVLELVDEVCTNRVFQLEDHAGPDRLDDGGGSAFLALLNLVRVLVGGCLHKQHGAAAWNDGDRVLEEVAAGDQDARRARPARHLVRRDEDGVHVGQVAVGQALGGEQLHVDVQVGPAGRVVPEGQEAVAVQDDGDFHVLGDDAGDVGGGGEGADLQALARLVLEDELLEVDQVNHACLVQIDLDDIGDGLAPGQDVAVVLVWAVEDDGPLVLGDAAAQVVLVAEVVGDADVEHADELVDGSRGARAAKDDGVVLDGGVDGARDHLAGLAAEHGGLQARGRGFGVRVGVHGHDAVTDKVFDEGEAAARGGPVGIDERLGAIDTVVEDVGADEGGGDSAHESHALVAVVQALLAVLALVRLLVFDGKVCIVDLAGALEHGLDILADPVHERRPHGWCCCAVRKGRCVSVCGGCG